MHFCITFICVICNRGGGVNAAHPEGDGRRRPSHRQQEHGNDPFLFCDGRAGRQYGRAAARHQRKAAGWSCFCWREREREERRGWRQVGASAVSSLDATSPAVDGGSNPQAGRSLYQQRRHYYEDTGKFHI